MNNDPNSYAESIQSLIAAWFVFFLPFLLAVLIVLSAVGSLLPGINVKEQVLGLRRAWALKQGNVWRIFWTIFLFVLILAFFSFLAALVIGFAIGVLIATDPQGAIDQMADPSLPVIVITGVITVVTTFVIYGIEASLFAQIYLRLTGQEPRMTSSPADRLQGGGASDSPAAPTA